MNYSIKRQNIIISVFFLLTCSTAKSQDSLEKNIRTLHYFVDRYIQKADKYYENRKPEAILMILEADSCGKIRDIHLLGDKKNVDTTYSILEKLKPADFSEIKFSIWKNKTINLLIYSLPGPTFDNNGRRILSYIENSIVHISSAIGSRNAILLRPLYYLPPGRPRH